MLLSANLVQLTWSVKLLQYILTNIIPANTLVFPTRISKIQCKVNKQLDKNYTKPPKHHKYLLPEVKRNSNVRL